MFDPILEWVRQECSGERALEAVRSLARFHRVQASPGYDEAARWIGEQLADAGIDHEVEHVPGNGRTRGLGILMPRGWVCDRARASLIDRGRSETLCDYGTEKLSLILRSAPAHGRYRLVALEDGTEPSHYDGVDVRECVVLTSGSPHRVHQLAVIERGAAGLLCDGRRLFPPVRGESDERDALSYTSFWWSDEMPRGWGFVVTPERGDQLRERLRGGSSLELEVEIASREFETTIPLVSAIFQGETQEEVVVVSHLCHPQPSANDNASGAAALLETARILSAGIRRQGGARWRSTVRLLWMPELSGTAAHLAIDRERGRRTVAALNLDMVGEDQAQCGSTLHVEHPPCFAASFAEVLLTHIRRAAQDWITSYAGAGHSSLERMSEIPYGGGSDHAVFLDPSVGVPCPMLIQWPDRFYHSSHDTPDRCDPRSLALAARSAATYVAHLAALDRAGAREVLDLVARDARRRLLDALDSADPAREVERARLRGTLAIQSLSRLLDEPARLAAAAELFEGFCAREGGPTASARTPLAGSGVRAEATARAACPRRRIPGPLEFHAHLLPGHRNLDAAERERLRNDLAAFPGGRRTLDVTWAACDGRRSLDEMAHLVWLETGEHIPVEEQASGRMSLARFFEWTDKLGLTSWDPAAEETWSLAERDTVTS